jgi:hypothetical protein
MSIRTTVDIPDPLHDALRERAERTGSSIRSLIIRAIEQTYAIGKHGRYVTGALVKTKGKLGPDFPVNENPHDIVFS